MSNTYLIKPVTKISHIDKLYEAGQEYEVSKDVVDALGDMVEIVKAPKPEKKQDEDKKDEKGKSFNPPKNAAITGKEEDTKKK